MKACIFDLGATLFAHGPYRHNLENVYPRLHRYLIDAGCEDVPPLEKLLTLKDTVRLVAHDFYIGSDHREITARQAFGLALKQLGVKGLTDQIIDRVVEIDHEAYSESVEVVEGAEAALKALKEMGLKVGLLSNTLDPPEHLTADLRVHGLDVYFDDLVYSSEFGRRKPHYSIYVHSAKNLGVPPEECLFIGDRVREDVLGPRAVGMTGVLTQQVRQDPYDPVQVPYVIQRIDEIIRVVEEVSAA